MAIIKAEDIVAWRDAQMMILCDECCDREEDEPLTDADISVDDIVICDKCKKKIR